MSIIIFSTIIFLKRERQESNRFGILLPMSTVGFLKCQFTLSNYILCNYLNLQFKKINNLKICEGVNCLALFFNYLGETNPARTF